MFIQTVMLLGFNKSKSKESERIFPEPEKRQDQRNGIGVTIHTENNVLHNNNLQIM